MGDIDIVTAFLRKEPFKRGNVRSNGIKLFVDDTCIGQWINHNLGQRVLLNNSTYDAKMTKVQGLLYKTLTTSHLIFRVLKDIDINTKDLENYDTDGYYE